MHIDHAEINSRHKQSLENNWHIALLSISISRFLALLETEINFCRDWLKKLLEKILLRP